MKALFKIIFFLLLVQIVNGQAQPLGVPTVNSPSGYYNIGWLKSLNGIIPGSREPNFVAKYGGTIIYRPSDGQLYYYDSTILNWRKLSVGSDTTPTTLYSGNGNIVGIRDVGLENNGAINFNFGSSDGALKLNTTRLSYLIGADSIYFIPGEFSTIGINPTNDLHFMLGGQPRVIFQSNGFVGLGTQPPLEMLDVNGNIQSRDAFIIYNPSVGTMRGELYHAGTYLGLRTITPDPIVIRTDNTERSRYTADGFFNVAAKTNLIGDATAPVVDDTDSSNAIETTGRTKRLIAALETAIPLYTASGGVTKVGNDFRLGGTLPGSASIDGLNTGYFSLGNMYGIDLYGPTTGGGSWGISSNFGDMSLIWERDKARRAINMNVQNGGMILNTNGATGFGNGSSFILDTLGRFYLNGLKPAAGEVSDSVLMWSPALGQVKYRSLASLPFATRAALDDSALALRAAMIIPPKIVIGTEVDPLYSFSVKKVYDNVTQANFSTTVGKYPFYVDKDVRFTEDSMSMWPVPGDNAGLNILRYKGQSVLNFENTVNRFTAHHTVLSLEKHPSFNDTTIFMGRAAPYPAETCVPSGFSAILSQSQSGLNSTKPNISRGWFAALSAEVQMGGGAFNKAENMIWIHTGGIGNAAANAITNGYGLYINPFGTGVTNKYAIYQQGTLDSNYFAGKIKMPNLTARTDTTSYKPAVVDASGNLSYLSYWPTGSGGSGITSLNTLTDASQTFATGTTGTDFNINSASGVHTFNIPDASATARGLVTTGTQTFAGNKTFSGLVTGAGVVSTAGVAAGTAAVVQWSGRSTMRSGANGNIMLANQAGTDFGLLQGGGITSSFPAWQRSGAGWISSLADGSGHTTITASGLTLSGLAGTGTRIGTVSSTGVSGAIANGSDGQVMTMVSGSLAWATPDFASGSYTPTFSNLDPDISGVTIPPGADMKWMRIGKVVTVWGICTPTLTGGALNDIIGWSMSLPPGMTGSWSQFQEGSGVANCTSVTRGATAEVDPVNDLLHLSVQLGSEGFATVSGIRFSLSFIIQ